MPNVSFDIVDLDSIYDSFLVDSASKRKHVVVLEGAEADTCAWDAHLCEDFPLVLLGIVLLAVAVYLVVDESADDVEETLDGTNAMICMRIVHRGYLEERPKKFVIPVATFQVHVHSFEIASSKIDGATLGSNRPRIKGHFMGHSHRASFELPSLDLVDLGAPLVPLERMEALNPTGPETVFRVEVDSKVALDQGVEFPNNLIGILVKKSLQL